MGRRKVTAAEKLDVDKASLQFKIRSDPKSYETDFKFQYNHYQSQRDIFLGAGASVAGGLADEFVELVDLIAHVADCYPTQTTVFVTDLRAILVQHHAALAPNLREKVVGSLVLLRRKDLIDAASLLTTLFPVLVSTPSKSLRSLLFTKIVSELRNANAKGQSQQLNRTIQTALYDLVTADRASPKALWAVKLTREMWRRQVWTDAKPVDVMRQACLADNEKVAVGAVRFFLGGDKEREEMEDDSSDDEGVDIGKIKHQMGINKKTRKKSKAMEKAIDKVKRQERKKNQPHPLNFSAFHLLHDPQGFAEHLFSKHLQNTKAKLKLESKLLVLQLVTRLVGLHKLTVTTLYSWFIKYLTPRQESVTSFLASLAQAVHDLVPPQDLEPILARIANEFVSEASAAEVAAVGLNAIREICARQPLAMSDTLLQDLVQYKKSKDKGVMMAAKGLLSLYREVGADLLKKKDRGKGAAMALRAGEGGRTKRFGEEGAGGIDGIELLWQHKEGEKKRKRAELGLGEDKRGEGAAGADAQEDDEDEFNSSDWEVDSDGSVDSGGWIDVSSDDEADAPAAKKQKTKGPQSAATEDEPESIEIDPEKVAKLMTSTVLTPADLAKLQELRVSNDVRKAMGGGASRKKAGNADGNGHLDEGLTAEQIELPTKLRKATKEERRALAKEGKPDREEHKSTQAIRRSKKDAAGKSTTNKEKARKKNLFMTLGKAKSKQKRSLVETSKVLRGHIARSKRGGRRWNGT